MEESLPVEDVAIVNLSEVGVGGPSVAALSNLIYLPLNQFIPNFSNARKILNIPLKHKKNHPSFRWRNLRRPLLPIIQAHPLKIRSLNQIKLIRAKFARLKRIVPPVAVGPYLDVV